MIHKWTACTDHYIKDFLGNFESSPVIQVWAPKQLLKIWEWLVASHILPSFLHFDF